MAFAAYGSAQTASFQSFPPAQNGVLQVCEGQSVTFINTSTGLVPGSSFFWSFGTGAIPAAAAIPGPVSTIYSTPTSGSFVTLTVNNNDGTTPSTYTLPLVVANTPEPELSLEPPATGFAELDINGQPAFTYCAGSGTTEFSFLSNYSAAFAQTFGWGDGTAAGTAATMTGSEISHAYAPGQYTLTHTVVESSGCSATQTYTIFNGSAPVITVSGAGSTSCIPAPYPVTILSNGVVIDYVVSFSDGSAPVAFTTSNDTTVTHSFTGTSCDQEYAYAPGLPPIENAFSASIVASNLCSVNGLPTVFTIGPLSISAPTEAAISSSAGASICQGGAGTFTDVSEPGVEVSSQGCESNYSRWWTVQPLSGVDVVSGDWGSYSVSGSESIELEFSATGTYTVWLYTANACGVDSTSHSVSVLPAASVAVDPSEQTVCSGSLSDITVFTSSVAGYTVQWNVVTMTNAAVAGPLSGAGLSPAELPPFVCTSFGGQPGTIEIHGTVGCSNEAPAVHIIHVEPAVHPLATPSVSQICSGASSSIDLSSNDPDALFSWTVTADNGISGATNGAGTSIENILSNSGSSVGQVTYTILISGVECPGEPVQASVSVYPELEMPPFLDLNVCPGDQVIPTALPPSIQGAAFTWDLDTDDLGLVGPGNGWVPAWTAASNSSGVPIFGTVTVVGQVADCPSDSSTFLVTIQPTLSPTASPSPAEICTSTSTAIQLSGGGPNAVLAWTASSPSGLSGTSNGSGTTIQDVLVNSTSGPLNATYTVTISGVSCPGDAIEVLVVVYPEVDLPELSDLEGCPGEVFVPSAPAPGIQGASFSYTTSSSAIGLGSPGVGWVPSWTGGNNATGVPLVATVTVSGYVADCPVVTEDFLVTLYPTPEVTTSVSPNGGLDCTTSVAQIQATSNPIGCTFAWTGPGIVSGGSSSSPSVNQAGTYTVTVIQPTTGCSAIETVVVQPAASISIVGTDIDQVACAGEASGSAQVFVSGPGPFTYAWNPAVSVGPTAQNLGPGSYSVVVTNASGCSDTISFDLESPQPIQLWVLDLQESECGESNGFVQVSADGGAGGYVFSWNTGEEGPLLMDVDAGVYQVEVTDAEGCSVDLEQALGCVELITPVANTFISPNGDDLNSVWRIQHIELFPQNEVQVFNRWGNCVHRASPYTNTWDGTFTEGRDVGKRLPSATYYFVIDTRTESIGKVDGFLEIQSNE